MFPFKKYSDRLLRHPESYQARKFLPVIRSMARDAKKEEANNSTITFAQFVRYLLKTEPLNYDPHWRPAALNCAVCSSSVLTRRNRVTLIKMGKNAALNNSFRIKLPRLNAASSIKEDAQKILRTQLSSKEIHLLAEKYITDLTLFGYKSEIFW